MSFSKYHITRAKVFAAQDLRKITRSLIKSMNRKSSVPLTFIEDLDHFYPDVIKEKKALITLPPWAWQEAVAQEPDIRNFNFTGLLYEMVRGLNGNGYKVDVLDLNIPDFDVKKDYDILVGHGGGCKAIIQQLKPEAKILQYVSGAYFQIFNEETEVRYARFKSRNQLQQDIGYKRRMESIQEGERFLTENAHVLFSCNAPRMVNTFGKNKNKFFFTGLAAYINEEFKVDLNKKQYSEGRRNFIYVGGTSGNIQKGADVLIEAFALVPEAHLYIYCELEPEILRNYRKELSLPNIHYIYHYRYQKNKLNKLLTKINYTVHAPINTGVGTAFVGSMGTGLIPVGYIDLPPNDYFILSESYEPGALANTIRQALSKSPEWCRQAAENAVAVYYQHWNIESFSKKFNQLIAQLTTSTDVSKAAPLGHLTTCD